MALIGNYSLLNRGPYRQFATGISSGYSECYVTSGANNNRHYGGFAKFAGTPVGYSHPAAWVMAKQSGGLASFTGLTASVSTTDALLALGINVDANLSATITKTDAILALIVALEASITASGSITDANMAIIILLEAALSATGQFTDAQLGNILGLAANLSANMTLTNSITNLVNLSANISNAADGVATPEQIAAAVWEALLADYQTSGSMGEAMGNAGSGGNPWSALLASNITDGTFGKRVQELLTENNFIGLK